MFNNFFNSKFKINNFNVGEKKTYIIAEAGSNHNGNFNLALKLIDAAKYSGANAIKFQLFKSHNLIAKDKKKIKYLKKFEFKRSWLPNLIRYCKKKKIHFLASPFDEEACDLLLKNKVKAIKIASTQIFNLKMINYLSKKNIPLIISTGIADYADIFECLDIIKKNLNKNIALLQCSSIYPAKKNQLNLKVIDNFKRIFKFPIGFSDHSEGILAAKAAVAKGAHIIEKHFTLDKNLEGPDHNFSVEISDFKNMVDDIRSIEKMQGNYEKFPLHPELEICRKNGLYVNKKIKKNQTLRQKDIVIKNPQKGIEARYLKLIEGLKTKKEIPKGKPISWTDL